MNKKNLVFIIAIVCCNFSYGNENSYSHHQAYQQKQQQSHLSPEKQVIFNNYQRRLDTLYHLENNPSNAHSGLLVACFISAACFFYGITQDNKAVGAGGALGFGASGLYLLVNSAGASASAHERSKEIAEILEKMKNL